MNTDRQILMQAIITSNLRPLRRALRVPQVLGKEAQIRDGHYFYERVYNYKGAYLLIYLNKKSWTADKADIFDQLPEDAEFTTH